MKRIYLDNNATTSVAPSVKECLLEVLDCGPCNASSVHEHGQKARKKLVQSRDTVARFLGVSPREIIFTSGGTEGLNMLIHGILAYRGEGHVISSDLEHAAVFNTLKNYEALGTEVTFLSGGARGAVTADQVRDALTPDTRLISLMAVNNETGVKTDIEAIAAIAREAKVPFVVDGVALMGKELFRVPDGVSAMAFSGHKFHATSGIGFVFVRRGQRVLPLITGGGQEGNKRAGTENLAAISGLAEAVRLISQSLPEASERMRQLRDKFELELIDRLGAEINGTGERVVNTSCLRFPEIDGESLLIALDMEGLEASHGSACSSGALQPSRVLLNMGLSRAQASSSLRFSLSRETTESDIVEAIEVLCRVVQRLRGEVTARS